ncbi:hypothetical protein Q604_UNBC12982G0001, partial [human gut metagenome]
IEAANQLQNEIKELRKEQIPEQAIETWAKNQIVLRYCSILSYLLALACNDLIFPYSGLILLLIS